MDLIFGIICVVLSFVAWLVAEFLCEHKYYWCKGKCSKCLNWKCRYFETDDKEIN